MKTVIIFSIIVLFSSISLAQPIPTTIGCRMPLSTTPSPPKEEVDVVIEFDVDERAEFPGGKKELIKFLAENMKYPDIARELGLQGKSILRFVVGVDSTISNVQAIRGMKECKECDQEAIRIVRMMPCWRPAKKNGKDVNSYFILPVEFRLH
ncbi:MAG TPA: energy transducer TonB [Crocinitomicaceae bacterium]|nr:energy transducer TonB [Crocinitomicaceae bacterium]